MQTPGSIQAASGQIDSVKDIRQRVELRRITQLQGESANDRPTELSQVGEEAARVSSGSARDDEERSRELVQIDEGEDPDPLDIYVTKSSQ